MTRRAWIRCAILGAILLPVGLAIFWYAVSAGSSAGSPELAREWKTDLERYGNPDEAKRADRDIIVLRCENGDWVFGRSVDSHGTWHRGGGTVVVRDSAGRTRAFFGHVCGGGHFGFGPAIDVTNLENFYTQLKQAGFREHGFE